MDPMKAPMRRKRDEAEMLAVEALAFIAAEPERLGAFLAATGLEAERIRAAARAPGFLAGVLEHMLGDESLLLAFAASAGIDPGAIAPACAALGGQKDRSMP
jgi:hypothetical protein